jgi:hypothetical protein
MTRINCIPVEELTDKHLLAEYRELPRIAKLAKHCTDAPAFYKLGTGHVKFFYDKGSFLKNRFENEIVPEMQKRGFTTNFTKYREHPNGLNKDWIPTETAKSINRERIKERLTKVSKKSAE